MRITTHFNFTDVPMRQVVGGVNQWNSSVWQAPDAIRSMAHHIRATALATHCGARRVAAFGNNQYSECVNGVTFNPDGYIGPMTRMQTTTNASGYLLTYRPIDGVVRLYKVDDSGGLFTSTQITTPQGDVTVTATQPANVKLVSSGSNHTAYLNGVAVGNWVDTTYSGGQPGFWVYEFSFARQAMFDGWRGGDLDSEVNISSDFTAFDAEETPLSEGGLWTSGPGGLANVNTEFGLAYSAVDINTYFSHSGARRNLPLMDTEQFSENNVCDVPDGGAWVGCATNIQSETDGTCYFLLLFHNGNLMLYRYDDPDPTHIYSTPYSDPTSADFTNLGTVNIGTVTGPLAMRLESKSDGLRAYINGVQKTFDTGSVVVDPGIQITGGQPGICFFARPQEANIRQWTGGDWTANAYAYVGSVTSTVTVSSPMSQGTNSGNHSSVIGDITATVEVNSPMTGPSNGGGGGGGGPWTFTATSFNTGAIADSQVFNIGISANLVILCKLKVVPSASTIGYVVEIFKKTTCLPEDKQFATKSGVQGNLYVPTDRSGNEVQEGFIIPYQDLDAGGEIHIKVTNLDPLSRSYDISLSYIDPSG